MVIFHGELLNNQMVNQSTTYIHRAPMFQSRPAAIFLFFFCLYDEAFLSHLETTSEACSSLTIPNNRTLVWTTLDFHRNPSWFAERPQFCVRDLEPHNRLSLWWPVLAVLQWGDQEINGLSVVLGYPGCYNYRLKECQIEYQNRCQKECQNRCQKECQNRCQKECQNRCQKECQNKCQKECQNRCQKECQNRCQKECQNKCQIGMSE